MAEMTEADARFTVDAWEETPYDEPAEVLTAHGAGSGYVASGGTPGTLTLRYGGF